jgi:hypothetical protein
MEVITSWGGHSLGYYREVVQSCAFQLITVASMNRFIMHTFFDEQTDDPIRVEYEVAPDK